MSKDTKELTNSIADYRVVDIDTIVPYWRNPYDNNDTAVDAVATSIEELLFPTITMVEPAELPKPLESASTQATGQENIDDVEIELICPNCMNGFTATWGEVKEMIKRGREMGDGD